MNTLIGTVQVGMQHQIQFLLKPSLIMILFHDSSPKTTTVEALPKIIENYKERGYVFKAISKDTPEFHHDVNN